MHGAWRDFVTERTQKDLSFQRLHVCTVCLGQQKEADHGKTSKAEATTGKEPWLKERAAIALWKEPLGYYRSRTS